VRDGLAPCNRDNTGTNIARKPCCGRVPGCGGQTIDRNALRNSGHRTGGAFRCSPGVEGAVGRRRRSISMVKNKQDEQLSCLDPELLASRANAYIAMLDTPRIVAKR